MTPPLPPPTEGSKHTPMKQLRILTHFSTPFPFLCTGPPPHPPLFRLSLHVPVVPELYSAFRFGIFYSAADWVSINQHPGPPPSPLKIEESTRPKFGRAPFDLFLLRKLLTFFFPYVSEKAFFVIPLSSLSDNPLLSGGTPSLRIPDNLPLNTAGMRPVSCFLLFEC